MITVGKKKKKGERKKRKTKRKQQQKNENNNNNNNNNKFLNRASCSTASAISDGLIVLSINQTWLLG